VLIDIESGQHLERFDIWALLITVGATYFLPQNLWENPLDKPF